MSSALAARALPELLAGAPQADVLVHGRVALHLQGGFRLEQDGVAVRVAVTEEGTEPPSRQQTPRQEAPRVELGAIVAVRGSWDGRELNARSVEVKATPQRLFGHADSEFAWAQRGGIARLQRRHRALRALRAFFDGASFTEVETPAVVRSPGLELHLEALEVVGAGEPRYLHTSPEYHMKRLLTAGMSRIFQLCKAYRRGELGASHQPEFTMLEWYRAFSGADQLMRDTEQLAAALALELNGTTRIAGERGPIELAPPWERLTVRDAFARFAGASMDDLVRDEEAFYRTLVERVEPELGRSRPMFLTHYPASMAALARLRPDDPEHADRFEAYVDGIELCNGFGELTDATEQRRRFEHDLMRRSREQRPCYPIDERFLDALLEGMPESAGNALGFDRLLMLLEGVRDIAQVVAFAATRS